MKRNLKIISLLLVTVLTLSLFGCSGEEPDREYDEAEVLSAAGRLIKLSETLNRIYYGEGIGYTDGEGAVGAYKPADTAELKRLGFSTVEELKAKTRVVFSKKMSETMFYMVNGAEVPIGQRRLGEVRVRYENYRDQKNLEKLRFFESFSCFEM